MDGPGMWREPGAAQPGWNRPGWSESQPGWRPGAFDVAISMPGDVTILPPAHKKKRRKKLAAGCHCPRGSKPTKAGGCFKMKRGKIRIGDTKKFRMGKFPVAVKVVCRKRKR